MKKLLTATLATMLFVAPLQVSAVEYDNVDGYEFVDIDAFNFATNSTWSFDTFTINPQVSVTFNPSFPLQAGDRVDFNFNHPSSHMRVGMTNTGNASGARWASSPTSTFIIPSAGQWSVIIMNTFPTSARFSGSATIRSMNAFSIDIVDFVDNDILRDMIGSIN